MPLARLYPLSDLPEQRRLWSWISYDVANQSFTLLINTLLFSIFFTEIVVEGAQNRNTLWSLVGAISMGLTVIASPLLGAIADAKAWKKELLLISGTLCAICTCLLALIKPGQFWIAALLYIPANFAFSLGENFLASFLPELADRRDFGRVSGFSWAMAYSAALLLLVFTAGAMMMFKLEDPQTWRPFFVFAGAWFLVFMIPTAVFLREQPPPADAALCNVWTIGFTRLATSLRNTRRHRDLATLLVASLFYGAGMSVVIFFASIIAKEFGFNSTKLVIFVGVITVSGVIGTIIPTVLQDRIGHKKSTLVLLVMWVLTTLLLAGYTFMYPAPASGSGAAQPTPLPAPPTWPIWVLGNLLGLGLGSLGSANRAFVGYLAPSSRSAEVFGLWGMVFKLAAILTIPFAIAKDRWGTPTSLLVLTGFLLIGLALTLLIDERRGVEAATAADAA